MGGANVLHGVSGGSVAFLPGVYEEWIYTLTCFDLEAFHLLRRLAFRALWNKLNGPFLLTIFGGILAGLLFLSVLLYRIARLYPVPVYSFFFGLLIMAAPLTLRRIKVWNVGTALGLVFGIAISYGLTLLSALSVQDYWWMMLIAGFITSCGMVWTSISCAFFLLLLGQ